MTRLTDEDFAAWQATLVIVGDEALLPAEVQRREELNRWARHRYANRRLPCPGPRCLTLVRGGGLCSFCRRP